MTNPCDSPSPDRPFEPTILYQLRLVARIALGVSGVALLALLAVIALLARDTSADNYLYSIQSLAVTRQSLGPILFGAGLVLAGTSGLVTWLISLHSSSQISGPLYRFARNLEFEIAQGVAPRVGIRASDALHGEAHALQQSVDRITRHYASLLEAVESVERALEQGDRLQQAVARLAEVEGRVRIDD